jgi:glycosyltransferase involved in cell wall biosynthesis
LTISAEAVQISVVIPSFNRADLVGRAILSACDQQLCPYEIIVVDDGSTDRTRLVVKAYGERVRYVYQVNSGAAAARNRGVREATGNYIAFLDSDDYWDRSHLASIVQAIRHTSGRALFYFTDAQREGETQWVRSGFSIRYEYQETDDASDWLMRRVHPCVMSATVFQREAILGVGGFRESLSVREDTHLYFRLGLGGRACAVSNLGATITGDAESQRLTSQLSTKSRKYSECTIELYSDLLDRGRTCPRHRIELQRRLASAYITLAGVEWREKHDLNMVWLLVRGFYLNPGIAWQRILLRIRNDNHGSK